MSFDWEQYLSLAEYMQGHVADFPDAEACYRSVISRAYYAAMCLCRNYVKEHEGKEFSGDIHKALQNYLKENPHNKIRTRIGNQLQQLHQDRVKADYYDDMRESPVYKAGKALIQAKKIINNLSYLS
jgi:uncharacterized protein (UPF0332 family)